MARYVTVRCGWTRTDHWYITVSYVTLCYGTLRMDTYGSLVHYGFLRYAMLREGGKQALTLWLDVPWSVNLKRNDFSCFWKLA